ncbi:hypothetical protein K1719_011453 [Acacia pycnantha]|nr:hypothetical protein K1719_011453 [Acacia pycnantha]
MEVSNRFIVIKDHIEEAPKESHFNLKTESLSLSVVSDSDDVIVRNLYISIDPYQINRMKSHSSSQKAVNFAVPITPNQAIDGLAVGKVVACGSGKFEKDDVVVGVFTWAEYSLVKEASIINKLDNFEFPLTYHLGVLGFNGLSAYAGFFELCKPKKGEKVFVSAASGSVGCLAAQYAKLFGCYVVGSAGSQKKVEVLKDKLGLDDAFNYKEETDLKSALKRYFPEGIDIYFDNVGGDMLEAAVDNMNAFGRVAVCGVISEYTNAGKRAAPDMLNVVYKRLNIRGFLAADFLNIFADFVSHTSDHLRSGKLLNLEDYSYGVDNIPSSFIGLFNGDNIGKKIVKLAEDE